MSDLTSPSDLPVSAVSSDTVVRVSAGSSLRDVARTMADGDVSIVAVGEDTITGVVSERDIVRSAAAGDDLDAVTAADVAQTNLIWTLPDVSILDVAGEMMGRWVRHVLIGEEGQVAGIVSARDLLGAFAAAEAGDLD